jgi:hypothetical protein
VSQLAPPPRVLDAPRVAAELRGKIAGLETEFAEWRQATCPPDGALRRHHTQVAAVSATLSGVAADITSQLVDADEGTWIFDRARTIDRAVSDLHRLWGFFRGKLALRYVPWLETSLVVADDLAWACYRTAQQFIPAERRREPPLVYLTGGTTPFLVPRGSPYVVEPLPDGGMREPDFDMAVRTVPVALIGVPWFQLDFLPAASLIPHEVGHAVEQDLGLAADVKKLISDAVPKGHRPAWKSWSGEVFADVYGVLGCGSAFCRALASLLTAHPREIAGERRGPRNWGSYPTRTLRVLLTVAVLKQLNIDPPDEPIAEPWRAAYPQRPLVEYEDDVEAVVKAVLEGPYPALGDGGLDTALSFTSDDEANATRNASNLLKGRRLDPGNVRQLIAAARHAYERDRVAFEKKDASSICRTWVAAIPFDGVRAAGGADTPPAAEQERRDSAATHALSALITGSAQLKSEETDEV